VLNLFNNLMNLYENKMRQNKMFKKVFLILMFVLVINISLVIGTDYKIDYTGDGIGDETFLNVDDLQWRIFFVTFGGNNFTQLPKLNITGSAILSIQTSNCRYYACNPISQPYEASWISQHFEDIGDNIYYTFEHWASSTYETAKLPVGVGTYKINMVAYGDAPSPPTLDSQYPESLARWGDENCGNPFTTNELHYLGTYHNESFETQVSVCTTYLREATICPVCRDVTTSCTEYDSNNGYLCNGVYAAIQFYDGEIPKGTYDISGWDIFTNPAPEIRTFQGQNPDDPNAAGRSFITDTTPDKVNVTHTIHIFENCFTAADCPDPGVCLVPTCISDQCGQAFETVGYQDPGCPVVKPYCNGTGSCVECTQASHCGTSGLLNEFICSGNRIQQKNRTYYCNSNTCSYLDTWRNRTLCISPQVCYNPTGASDCCTPFCGGGTPYECGDNQCGGNCGVCPPEKPACNIGSHICEGTGIAYWADMNGDKIGEGGYRTHAQINDTVLLVYQNQGAQVGNFNFSIWEKDNGPVDFVDNEVRTIPASQTFNYRGNLAAQWFISSSDFYLQSDSGEAEFYFMINSNQSKILKVNDSSTAVPDFPTVVIIEPVVNSKVRVGNVINFTQFAKDTDSDLRIKWIFGDGEESDWMLNCLTTGNCNTTHTYTDSGTKVVEIIAREMTGTNEAINYSQVFAYNLGINVFAVITNPPFGIIYTTGVSSKLVPFNANTSYIANCTTDACPGCAYDVAADLHCYNLNKTALDIPSKYNLDFNWTFSEGVGRNGRWYPNADYNWVVEFERLFYAPTQHWARLIVNYIPKP